MKVRLAMAVDAIDERDATIADLEARLVTLAGKTGRQATIIAGLTSTVELLTTACERLRGERERALLGQGLQRDRAARCHHARARG